MFIQVIKGHTSDPAGLRRHVERWQRELSPAAAGYLGSTGGVAADGTVVVLARFESEAAARANSDRPEQGEWWTGAEKLFDGTVTFLDSADVDTMAGGGSDDAGFVQVMQGAVRDKARARQLEAELMPVMAEQRPDVIGSVRAWDGNRFTEAIYFRSEAEARKGEAGMSEAEAAAGPAMEEYGSLFEGEFTYVDLTDPWLHTR